MTADSPDGEFARSEAALSALMSSVADGVIMVSRDGRVTRMNRHAERLTGWAERDAGGQSVDLVFALVDEGPEGRGAGPVQEALSRAAALRLGDGTVLIARDGSRRVLSGQVAPLLDAAGSAVGAVIAFDDEGDKRRADEALRRSEERLRQMIMSVKDYAIFLLDPSGRISSWNLGAERINGYKAGEIIGSHFSRFYPREDIEAGKPQAELERAAEEGRIEDDGWRLRKDGSRFWANVVITAVRDDDGELVGFAKVTRDLSERRRLEQAERQADAERMRALAAEEAVRQRDVFLSVAAHELRTPLTALLLKLEGLEHLMRRQLDDAAAALKLNTRVASALAQTRRLGTLVERLLDVSRIAAGGLEVNPEPLDLELVVRDALDDFREGREMHSEIALTVAGDTRGEWDRIRMAQVVVNLLSNAVKYGKGEPIEVTIEDRGQDVALIVSDRGIGIDAADLRRIFEPFGRAGPVQHFAGLGLGLHIARRIAEAHGGTIVVASEPGHGARFEVMLPRQRRTAHAAAAAERLT